MAGERYQHLDVSSLARPQSFTSRQQGGAELRLPTRDRARHSDYLRTRLNETWAAFENERQAIAQVEREGIYIEFVSEPAYDLMIKSLEDKRQGIRLRNVRTEGEGDQERTFATVFVPISKRSQFLNKINDYASRETQKGNPRNAKLINSVSDIRLAVVESFWHPHERSMIPRDDKEWVELWISTEQNESIESITALLESLNIESAEGIIAFPERIVKLILVSGADIGQLIHASDDIAEFRVSQNVASFYIELENREQLELIKELINRTVYSDESNVSICILDTGVNNGHILLQPILDNNDLHTVKPQWNVDDHDGHGTLMAGTAAYGDLLSILHNGNSVFVEHVLESSKIFPPNPNPKELWGYITSQGISLAEIQAPLRKRIICMAVTASDSVDRGRPSSWSGAIDELTSGYEDDFQRLIIISGGNVDPSSYQNYYQANLTSEVHDPGQAWNALTVGAFTEKVQIVDPTLSSYSPIAPQGGLSPFSTTSLTWPPHKWPIKPEVVFEGGNVAKGPNRSIIDIEDLKLISTHYQPQVAQLSPFWATSASAAQAAWFAAQVQIQYPELWPETIRALIIHSASWTDTMKKQFLPQRPVKADFEKLLRICGYGVPDLEKALYCMSNSLTLVSQATLQPFDKRNGTPVTRDMHIYSLPWPTEVLSELGETRVSMRVTLSYFVEPSPSEVGWKDRYRYASHALRFDINGPDESENEFVQRINEQARDGEDIPRTVGVSGNWTIGGQARNVGSIHSDIWKGQAADLAASNKIAVYPAVGWWRERQHLGRWNKECRYSLLVSIYTPEQEVDIYIPVAIQLGITVPVEIPVRY